MLDKYIKQIKDGDAIAFPTETVYGLGADAWNPSAIQKVFEIKGRPTDNPLIVHISSRKTVEEFAADIPEEAEKLMERFWPGPLTLIFKKKPEVLDSITAGLPTVALRWPSHPLSQELIALAGPLVAPSANSSGKPSPTKAEHVKEDFGSDFPVIEAGDTQIGLESTVLDVSEKPFRIYRPGAVGKTDIEETIGEKIAVVSDEANSDKQAPRSPGTKYSHYAPAAAVRWMKSGEKPGGKNTLYLFHDSSPAQPGDTVIDYRGDYSRMGRELYDRFRQADHKGLKEVAIEPLSEQLREEHALAGALANRISKAIGK